MAHAAPFSIVPKPSLEDEIKRDIIDGLKELLADAEAGNVSALVLIAKRPCGHWFDRRSGVIEFADAIGHLEIVKQNWIAAYLREQGE